MTQRKEPRILLNLVVTPHFPNAACKGKDPEMWVHQSGGDGNVAARRICRGDSRYNTPACPHLAECTAWAKSLVGTPAELTGVITGWHESSDSQVYDLRPCERCRKMFASSQGTKRFCTEHCRKRAGYEAKRDANTA